MVPSESWWPRFPHRGSITAKHFRPAVAFGGLERASSCIISAAADAFGGRRNVTSISCANCRRLLESAV